MGIQAINSSYSLNSGSNPLQADLNSLNQQVASGLKLEGQLTPGSAACYEAAKFVAEAAKAAAVVSAAIINGQTSLSAHEKKQVGKVSDQLQDQIYKIDADVRSGSISQQDGQTLLALFNPCLSMCEHLAK